MFHVLKTINTMLNQWQLLFEIVSNHFHKLYNNKIYFQYCEYGPLIIAHTIDTIQPGSKQKTKHAILQCMVKKRQMCNINSKG